MISTQVRLLELRHALQRSTVIITIGSSRCLALLQFSIFASYSCAPSATLVRDATST